MDFICGQKEAIERFVASVTVPILREDKGICYPFASGTLFDIIGRIFLITVRHIFYDEDGNETKPCLAFPMKSSGGKLYTIGDYEVSYSVGDKHDLDVAVLEIKCGKTLAMIREGWKCLSLHNVSLPLRETPEQSVFIAGNPTSLVRRTSEGFNSNFFMISTHGLPKPPVGAELPITEGIDLFYDYTFKAMSITGELADTPELPGVSGASVWEYRPHLDNRVWAPEFVMKVVGVQCAYNRGKEYTRAKSWAAVANVLKSIDETIANEIDGHAKVLKEESGINHGIFGWDEP